MNTNILSDGKSKTHSCMFHIFFECPSGCLCAGLDFKCILHGACGAIKNETKPKNKLQRKRSKFLRSGKWHMEFPSSQKACNQRTSAASFPRLSPFAAFFPQQPAQNRNVNGPHSDPAPPFVSIWLQICWCWCWCLCL